MSRAKNLAQRNACLSNLHHLGVATLLYIDDHDGRNELYLDGHAGWVLKDISKQ